MAERFFKNSVKYVATDAQAEIHFISMYPDSFEWIEVYGRLLSSNWEQPAALDPAPPYAARARQAAHPPSYQDVNLFCVPSEHAGHPDLACSSSRMMPPLSTKLSMLPHPQPTEQSDFLWNVCPG
jgi:hypothetical protein